MVLAARGNAAALAANSLGAAAGDRRLPQNRQKRFRNRQPAVHENRKDEIRAELFDLLHQLKIQIGKIGVAAAIEGIEQRHFMPQLGERWQKVRMFVALTARGFAIGVTPE